MVHEWELGSLERILDQKVCLIEPFQSVFDDNAVLRRGLDILPGDPLDVLPKDLFRLRKVDNVAPVRGGISPFREGPEVVFVVAGMIMSAPMDLK
jgi:hypothetical protein